MPIPQIYSYPIRRPNFLQDVQWIGQPGQDELALQITYPNASGINQVISLNTLNGDNAILCLPTTKTVFDLSEDVFVAHLRMAGMIPGLVPGSTEYADVLVDSGALDAKNYQMPIGDVKCISVTVVDDTYVDAVFQKGTQTPRTIRMGIPDLATYAFAPSTQLLVVAGAVKKQYPTYIQDPNDNKFLTQAQMDNIAGYVRGLAPWV